MGKKHYALFIYKTIKELRREILQLNDELGSYIRNFDEKDFMSFHDMSKVIDNEHEGIIEVMEKRKWKRITEARKTVQTGR
jgi:hypothetical protein